MPSSKKKKKNPLAILTPPLEQLQGAVDGKAEAATAEARSKTGELRVILGWQGRCNSTSLGRTGEETWQGVSLNSGGAENHFRSQSSAVT